MRCGAFGRRLRFESLHLGGELDEPSGAVAGKVGGFSLHAGVAARADQRAKLERLYRYISRPAVSEQLYSAVN